MARVTVEDCVEIVPNRFELVTLASQRARDIASGAAIVIDRDNDKDTVVSLREIADGKIKPDVLKEELIQGFQKTIMNDEIEGEDNMTNMDSQQIAEEMKSLQVNDFKDEDTEEEPAAGGLFSDENVSAND